MGEQTGNLVAFVTLAIALLGVTGGFFVWALKQESRMTSVESGIKAEHESGIAKGAIQVRDEERNDQWRIRMEKKLDDLIMNLSNTGKP